ncbi:MAG: molybdate ABC transporter substrate-binding protein [Planctomycetota bacterium]
MQRPHEVWLKYSLFVLVASIGCGWSSVPLPEKAAVREEEKPRSVTVAAASDLKFVFREMIKAFQREIPASVEATYGSSGNFYAQLSQKAPFDLYFSADADYPRKLLEAGLAVRGSERIYAIGRIVAWVRRIPPSTWKRE